MGMGGSILPDETKLVYIKTNKGILLTQKFRANLSFSAGATYEFTDSEVINATGKRAFKNLEPMSVIYARNTGQMVSPNTFVINNNLLYYFTSTYEGSTRYLRFYATFNNGGSTSTIQISSAGRPDNFPYGFVFLMEDNVGNLLMFGTIGLSGQFNPLTTYPYAESFGLGNYTYNSSGNGNYRAVYNVNISNYLKGYVKDLDSVDPYDSIPESEPSDKFGTGTFDFDSDPIPMSTLPTISAADTGFTRIYIPTLSQIQSLAQYLWTDQTLLTTVWNHIKQYFENPMEAFIGFNLVPCAIQSDGTEEFRVLFIGTGVQLTTAANQFVDVDCGTYTLEECFGSALDYSPYTKVHAYLPYIGQVELNVDEVMGKTLQVIYRIDIVTGSCVAHILVNSTVMYQFSGHCAINIPFTSSDFSNYVSAIISIAKTAVAVGAAGIGAARASAGESEVGSDGLELVGKTIDSESRIGFGHNTNNSASSVWSDDHAWNNSSYAYNQGDSRVYLKYEKPDRQGNAVFSGLKPGMIANTVGEIMSSKPVIQHAGSFSGNSGYLGVRRPYLIIERPNLANPAEYGTLNGRPSMITRKLSDISGFTKVQQVQLTGMTATQNEQSEILRFLKEGVIL